MEKWKIPSSAITASSSLSPDTLAWMGRLNSDWKTAWCAGENDDKQYLEVRPPPPLSPPHPTPVSCQFLQFSLKKVWSRVCISRLGRDSPTQNIGEYNVSGIFVNDLTQLCAMVIYICSELTGKGSPEACQRD